MKKFLISLLCCLFVSCAYSDILVPNKAVNDGFEIDFKNIDKHVILKAYIEGRVNVETAQAWCFKIFEYADAHDIDIFFEKDKGGLVKVSKKVCDTSGYGEDALVQAVFFSMLAAESIQAAKIEPHSKDIQHAMEYVAGLECKRDSFLDSLRRQGYDTYSIQTIVKCSDTDKRCIVSIPIQKGTERLMYTACCMVEQGTFAEHTTMYTDENGTHMVTTKEGTMGDVSVKWDGVMSKASDLDDVGYDCKPLNMTE